MSEQAAEKDAGLSESQANCLCAVWLGSKGNGSNARTLESLLRRGLVTVRQHQGAPLWETTERGSDLAASIMDPETEHDPRCYQRTGGIPDGLSADLCDCRTWRLIDANTRILPPDEGRTPIIHEAGCGWETGPYCTCGADPERIEES